MGSIIARQEPAGRRALRNALMASAAALVAGAVPAVASAQQSTPAQEAASLEEVVVTARRTEESMQSVPVAVTALSGAALEQRGIDSPTELQFSVPSLQMTTAFGRITGQFSIRGLSGGVTSYFAEVQGGPTDAAAPYYDIASVQVLNGPQGTLFGRSNTAGAVLVTPNAPRLDGWEGSFEVTQGNRGLSQFTAVVNVPLVKDRLAFRLAAHRKHLDGFTRLIGSNVRADETDSESLRLSVDWRPHQRLRNNAILDWYHVDQAASALVLAATNPRLAIFNLPASTAAPGGLAAGTATFGAACTRAVQVGLASDLNSCINQRLQVASTFRPILSAELARVSAGGDAIRATPASGDLTPHEFLKKYTFVNSTQLDLGQVGPTTVTVRNIFGYQGATGSSTWIIDGVGGVIQQGVAVSGIASHTQTGSGFQIGNRIFVNEGPYLHTLTDEVQVRGVVGDDAFVWSLGGYYQNQPGVKNLEGIRNVVRNSSGLTLPNLGYSPSFPFANGGFIRQRAVYGQATLDLTPWVGGMEGLHLTGGLRKTWDEQRLDTRAAVTDLPSGLFLPGAAASSATKSDGINRTLSLDAQITSDLLVYAATRKGYRPGGVNIVSVAASFPNFVPVYAPETVEDYELGAKYDFRIGDAAARLNVALYRNDYDNIQRTFTGVVNGISGNFIGNAAKARIQGVEAQGFINLGHLTASATYSYTDAKYTEWVSSDPLNLLRPGNARCLPQSTAAICLVDLSDSPFPGLARHQASLNLNYRLPVSETLGRISLSATGSYQTRRYFIDATQRVVEEFGGGVFEAITQKRYGVLNLRADWKDIMGSKVSAAAFVNNVTDKTYALYVIQQLHTLGVANKAYGEPRTFGLTLSYRFD